jgi:hypothetical protein
VPIPLLGRFRTQSLHFPLANTNAKQAQTRALGWVCVKESITGWRDTEQVYNAQFKASGQVADMKKPIEEILWPSFRKAENGAVQFFPWGNLADGFVINSQALVKRLKFFQFSCTAVMILLVIAEKLVDKNLLGAVALVMAYLFCYDLVLNLMLRDSPRCSGRGKLARRQSWFMCAAFAVLSLDSLAMAVMTRIYRAPHGAHPLETGIVAILVSLGAAVLAARCYRRLRAS